MKPRICVVQFPGVNCEYETARAADKVGMDAAVLRWNEPLQEFTKFDGFILPGGFSYQDRVRAGAIAATDEVFEVIIEQAAKGKPVLGICNGAQVLVEAGLVPGLEEGKVQMALAPNTGMGRGGYYCDWVYLKVSCAPARTAVTWDLEPGEILPVPIAHGEGRFTSSLDGLFDSLETGEQIVFKYCDSGGGPAEAFPENPNGSEHMAAAISNPAGNVVAMMPHPERCAWVRQVPGELAGPWGERRLASHSSARAMDDGGPGARVFRSMRKYIEEKV
jgi:phosphoribosylformylglycinamidine synthase I